MEGWRRGDDGWMADVRYHAAVGTQHLGWVEVERVSLSAWTRGLERWTSFDQARPCRRVVLTGRKSHPPPTWPAEPAPIRVSMSIRL
jgi:hypothetical protein